MQNFFHFNEIFDTELKIIILTKLKLIFRCSFEEANEEGPDAIIIAGDPQSADDVEFNQPNQHLIQDLDNENLPRKSDRSHLPESGTVPTAIFLGITNIVMILMVFLLPICCTRQGKTPAQVCLLEPFSWLLYCHTFYWLCHLVGDQYLKVSHNEILRNIPKSEV